jgi:hypothetical protein
VQRQVEAAPETTTATTAATTTATTATTTTTATTNSDTDPDTKSFMLTRRHADEGIGDDDALADASLAGEQHVAAARDERAHQVRVARRVNGRHEDVEVRLLHTSNTKYTTT